MLDHRPPLGGRDGAVAERENTYAFDAAPVALWDEDWSAVQTRLAELRACGVTDLEQHFDERPEEIRRDRSSQ